MNKIKKGAMFGLDARIALAIFGALSVISGAALYSAIQQAKVVSQVAEMNEIKKAVEQYMLDTARDITSTGTTSYLKIEHLLQDSGAKGWDGPYMGWDELGLNIGSKSVYYPGEKTGDNAKYYSLNASKFETASDGLSPCLAGEVCYYLIRLGRVSNNLADAIDVYVDGAVGADDGVVKTSTHSVGYKNVFYQGPLLLNQP